MNAGSGKDFYVVLVGRDREGWFVGRLNRGACFTISQACFRFNVTSFKMIRLIRRWKKRVYNKKIARLALLCMGRCCPGMPLTASQQIYRFAI